MQVRHRVGALVLLAGVAALWPAPAHAGTGDETDGEGESDDAPATTTTIPADTTAVIGIMLDGAMDPVEGVEFTVTAADGTEIGSVESDADGAWGVLVPAPGMYTVAIDPETLPDDLDLRDPNRTEAQANVFAGRPTRVLFPIGEAGAEGPNLLERLAQNSTNGIKFGLIIAMTAVGLSLIFGTTGLINFAHGELVTFGAVVAWFLNARGPHWPLLLAGAVAVAIGGLLGYTLERGIFRPLRVRQVGLFQLFIITIGLALAMRHAILIWFGGQPRTYADYALQQRWDLGPISITPRDLVIVAASIVVLVGIATMLQRTRMGKGMRAASDNPELSEASGIDVQRVVLVVWIMGAALAALGGIFLGVVEPVSYTMGSRLLLLMFAAVILGGLGTAYGAMVGGLIVGLVTEISTIWVSPSLKLVFALGALVLALLLRPQGILGRRERLG